MDDITEAFKQYRIEESTYIDNDSISINSDSDYYSNFEDFIIDDTTTEDDPPKDLYIYDWLVEFSEEENILQLLFEEECKQLSKADN